MTSGPLDATVHYLLKNLFGFFHKDIYSVPVTIHYCKNARVGQFGQH